MAVQTHFQLRDAQLNMDVIEKRVSGNERVRNWWVAGPEWPSCRCLATWGLRPGPHPPPRNPAYLPELNNLPESDTLTKVVQPAYSHSLLRFFTRHMRSETRRRQRTLHTNES